MFLFRPAAVAGAGAGGDGSTLLAVPFKATEKTVFGRALAEYIASSYAEPPEAYRDDLRVLDELREAATAAADANPGVLKRGTRYYGQLSFMLSKFPADVGIAFTWHSAFAADSAASGADLYFERAAVLFNVGAAYAQLGCSEGRGDKDGLTRAFAHFQHAAGVFGHLRRQVVGECRTPLTPDMATPMLAALEALMLCQAQECVWHRSVLGHMKDASIARIAAHVADLYDHALQAAAQAPLPQGWADHLRVKMLYFRAEAHSRKAMDCLAGSQYGEEVARLQAAHECCGQIAETVAADQRWARQLRPAVVEMARAQAEQIGANRKRAEHDNDVIYLDPVPSAAALPEIAPYRMAQPQVPDIIENPGRGLGGEELGPPLFRGLVPFVIHQAASLYEDRKDQLVAKDLVAALDELTADCESVLNSLNLPQALEAIQKPVGLPPSILVGADEIRSDGGYIGIKRLMDAAIAANATGSNLLAAAEKALDAEAREDQRVRLGAEPGSARARRVESAELTAALRADAAKYRGVLARARESDATIKKQVDTWAQFFALLGSPRDEIERQVPQTTNNPITDPHHAQIVARLQQYMGEVAAMKRERAKSVDRLRRIAAEDDITPALNEEMQRLAAQSATPILQFELHQFEDLFAQHLDKYMTWHTYVGEERTAQNELLDSVREANQAFIAARASHPLLHQRERALANLETAVKRYREASFNLHDGARFYAGLEAELVRLKSSCEDFAMARHLDALELTGAAHGGAPADLAQAPDQAPAPNLVWDPSMPLKYRAPK